MKNKIIFLVVIMFFISSFIDKKYAELVVVNHMDQVNEIINVEVEIHKIWSKRAGFGQVEVFVDYTANQYLRLVSKYVVNLKHGQVVHSERVSK